MRPPLELGQYTSIRYTDRLDELGAAPSVGSRGDAYDNAMAEAWVALEARRASAGTRARLDGWLADRLTFFL